MKRPIEADIIKSAVDMVVEIGQELLVVNGMMVGVWVEEPRRVVHAPPVKKVHKIKHSNVRTPKVDYPPKEKLPGRPPTSRNEAIGRIVSTIQSAGKPLSLSELSEALGIHRKNKKDYDNLAGWLLTLASRGDLARSGKPMKYKYTVPPAVKGENNNVAA